MELLKTSKFTSLAGLILTSWKQPLALYSNEHKRLCFRIVIPNGYNQFEQTPNKGKEN